MGNTFNRCCKEDETFDGPAILRATTEPVKQVRVLRASSGSFSSTTSEESISQSRNSANLLSRDANSRGNAEESRRLVPSPSFHEANGLDDLDYHVSEFLRNSKKDEISPRTTALNAQRARAESLGFLPMQATSTVPIWGMAPVGRIPVSECINELKRCSLDNSQDEQEKPTIQSNLEALNCKIVNRRDSIIIEGQAKPVKRNLNSGLGKVLQVFEDSMGTLKIDPEGPKVGLKRCSAHRRALSELGEVSIDELQGVPSRKRTDTDVTLHQHKEAQGTLLNKRSDTWANKASKPDRWRLLLEMDDESKLMTAGNEHRNGHDNSFTLYPRPTMRNKKFVKLSSLEDSAKAGDSNVRDGDRSRKENLLSLLRGMQSSLDSSVSDRHSLTERGKDMTEGGNEFGYFVERTPPTVASGCKPWKQSIGA